MTDIARLERLFQAAIELDTDQRSDFFAAEDLDTETRHRLQAMLADADSGDTLERPAGAPERVDVVAGTELAPGTVIDRYRLLEVLGEGGFGIVYRAEQLTPVRREVAVKVIKVGMDTREVVARFDAERQALAMMDHPSIARVLDGGATAEGRPYFVMELVRGIAITDYCAREKLRLAERLELFADVCEAVQHAHQKGVIHRDLKPSNILVALKEGAAVPKVIDFGVAKAMYGRLTDKTLFTAYHRFIGTPAYMSPEQAESSALDIDTRADVYSLGVVLYELLVGATPFDRASLARAGVAEIQRLLREQVPERPSSRVATLAVQSSAAGLGGPRGEWVRKLRGDLDWIVMKALEKERARRYATAHELAADVRRHLDDLPVLAGPPSHLYRLKKLLTRHRAAVTSAALVLLALVGGIVGTSFGLLEASRQRDAARHEAERAEAVTNFLVRTLSLADPEVALDPALSVRRLLDRAAQQADATFVDQPQAETRVRSTLGRAYESLGDQKLAEHHLRRAIELDELHSSLEPRERYEILWSLTHVLFKLERPDAHGMAHQARLEALELLRRPYPDVAGAFDVFIESMRTGAHLADPEPVRQAITQLDTTLALAEQQIPHGDALWPVVADSAVDGAYSLWFTPHEALSPPILEHVIRIRQRELPAHHADTGEAVSLLTGVLSRHGRAEEAEGRLRDSLVDLRRVFAEDGFQVAFAKAMLGDNLVAQGRFEEAEPLLLESHGVLLESSGDEASFYPIDSHTRIIRLYDAWDRDAQAAPFRLSLARSTANATWPITWLFASGILGEEHAELAHLIGVFDAKLQGYAYAADQGEASLDGLDLERLEHLLEGAFEITDERSVSIARLFFGWANALVDDGQRQVFGEMALQRLESRADAIPLDVAEALAISECRSGGDPERLERAGRLALRIESDSWFTANAKARVARCLVRAGRLSAARALLVPARDTLRAQLGESNQDLSVVQALLERVESAKAQ